VFPVGYADRIRAIESNTAPIIVEVELTDDEMVALRAWALPGSPVMTRLEAAPRLERPQADGGPYFWFTGTEAEALWPFGVAAIKARSAMPRIREAIRVARAKPRG
jgi:hypothetical protein